MKSASRLVAALVIASASAASVLAACLSFGDLQGGDASADAVADDSTAVEASAVDAPLTDAATSALGFCATQSDASFCDDFDELDAAFLSQWEVIRVTDGGASLTVSDGGYSGPNALAVGIFPNATSAPDGSPIPIVTGYIQHGFSGTVHKVRYIYAWRIDSFETTSSSSFFGAIDETSPSTSSKVEVRFGLNTTAMQFNLGSVVTGSDGGVTFSSLSRQQNVDTTRWHQVDIAVDYTQVPVTCTYLFDGVIVVSHAAIPGAVYGPGELTFASGFEYARLPTTGNSARIDNVAIFIE